MAIMTNTHSGPRCLWGSLAAIIALVSSACGGTSTSPTSPTSPTTSTSTTPQPFTQTVSGSVGVFGETFHPLTAPRSGSLRASLRWPSGVDLDLFLSGSSCTALYPKGACGLLASADGLANPEVITRSVTQGEAFRIWVDNLSEVQSANYTLTITIQ